MNNKKITPELINELVSIEIESAIYNKRDLFDNEIDYYTYQASQDSYIDLLLEYNVETKEEAYELQYLVLKEITKKVESWRV